MLLTNAETIDIETYDRVWQTAKQDVLSVFGPYSPQPPGTCEPPPSAVYKRFCAADPGMSQGMVSLKVQRFAIEWARAKNKRIRFLSAWQPGSADLNGYVSWLVVRRNGNELNITYDPRQMSRLTPERARHEIFQLLDLGTTHNLTFVHDKVVAKVMLHELGHASLHLEEILREMQHSAQPQISLKPEHEPQAWLYAMVVWGVFVGDHSYATRVAESPDQGYILC